MLLSSPFDLVIILFIFLGRDAAEVRLQPAELLDDPVPEATEHQTTDSAYAGAEGVMEGSDQHNVQASSCIICMFLTGGWRGDWTGQHAVQTVCSALSAHPGS